jgi:hypothetical protein
MKHHTVISTRKNPDKYIELLRQQGKHFFNYEKGVMQTAVFDNGTYTQVNIGSTVKFISKVIKMELNGQDKVVITFELGEARI